MRKPSQKNLHLKLRKDLKEALKMDKRDRSKWRLRWKLQEIDRNEGESLELALIRSKYGIHPAIKLYDALRWISNWELYPHFHRQYIDVNEYVKQRVDIDGDFMTNPLKGSNPDESTS